MYLKIHSTVSIEEKNKIAQICSSLTVNAQRVRVKVLLNVVRAGRADMKYMDENSRVENSWGVIVSGTHSPEHTSNTSDCSARNSPTALHRAPRFLSVKLQFLDMWLIASYSPDRSQSCFKTPKTEGSPGIQRGRKVKTFFSVVALRRNQKSIQSSDFTILKSLPLLPNTFSNPSWAIISPLWLSLCLGYILGVRVKFGPPPLNI